MRNSYTLGVLLAAAVLAASQLLGACGSDTTDTGGSSTSSGHGATGGGGGVVGGGGSSGTGGIHTGGSGGGQAGGAGGAGGACGEEVCDGIDNDCDGEIDEGQVATTCGLGICQTTVVGCDNGQPAPCIPGNAEPPEDCDGLDDDCDGDVDETCNCTPGEQQACYPGSLDTRNVGTCHDGTQSCNVNNGWDACSGAQIPQTEICDGLDNNCDGAVDEGCPCTDGEEQGCYTGSELTRGVGECHDGSQLCADSKWGVCAGDQPPVVESCDGLDNDCDGTADDGNPDGGAACDTGMSGPCGPGHEQCVGGSLSCLQDAQGSPDLCDGQDNDCDPNTADGSADPGVGQSCDGNDGDLCEEGLTACSGGSIVCGDNTGTNVELCNGVDDDCNVATPDGSQDPQMGQACDGGDTDLCTEGVYSCVNGSPSCSDNTGNNLEICNGSDDDCNPNTPDGAQDPQNGQSCDGPDSDLCLEGTKSCVGGQMVCSDNTSSTADICNGSDDDCDPASPDGSEDPQNGQPCDGPDSDQCTEGIYSCANGSLSCSDNTGGTSEKCAGDGQDEDCDGQTDEGFTLNDNPLCSSGQFNLGSVSGDTGSGVLTDTWYNEEWDRFTITEDNNGIVYLSAKVQLYSPPGVDFDLYVYCDSCSGGLAGSSLNGGLSGHTDTVTVRKNDTWGVGDDFTVIVEVRYYNSNLCAYWDLTVTGNVAASTATCN